MVVTISGSMKGSVKTSSQSSAYSEALVNISRVCGWNGHCRRMKARAPSPPMTAPYLDMMRSKAMGCDKNGLITDISDRFSAAVAWA